MPSDVCLSVRDTIGREGVGPGLLATLVPLALVFGCGGGQAAAPQEPEDSQADERERPGFREAAVPDVGGRDDDGMQVEGIRGHLTAYQIQMGVRPHQRALSHCYADGARYQYIGGRIVFGFEVALDGTVKHPRIDASALGAWGVEACLLDVVARMTFDPPDGGEAKVTLPLDFDARKPVATWGEERAARELAAPPDLPPTDDEAEQRRRRKERQRRRKQAARAGEPFDEPASKRADLARCAAEAEARPPSGLRITVYVDRRGRVTSAGFSARGPIDDAWAECAEGRITSWRMSPPQAPGVSVAKLEFSFPPDA